MAKKYKQRSGDRYDGRRIRSPGLMRSLLPHFSSRRSASQKRYEHSFDISAAESWIKAQRAQGYKGMSFIHIFIALFVRCCAYLPGLNRFVAGRRIYAHDDIEVVLAVKRRHAVDDDISAVKLSFEPTDTVYDVYRKLGKAVEELETNSEYSRTEKLAAFYGKFPRLLTRFFVWLTKVADYFGLLPKAFIDASPFHGSLAMTDNGPLGIGAMYNDLYDFGTVPVSICIGGRYGENSRYLDMKMVFDGRIADSEYFASAVRLMEKLIAEPSCLEITPEKVNNDVY